MSRINQQTQSGGPAPLRRESGSSAPVRMDGPLSDMPLAGGAAAPAEAAPAQLRFTVRYALPEYVSFMWQHGGYLIRRRRIGRLASLWLLSRSTSAAAMHFVMQGRARHLYDFTIDAHGIIRTNGTGVTLVPWSDVSAIRRYTRGFMLVLKRGTLPLPFRCLDLAQTAAIEGFAATLKAARR
jgi:hypothetical protein